MQGDSNVLFLKKDSETICNLKQELFQNLQNSSNIHNNGNVLQQVQIK